VPTIRSDTNECLVIVGQAFASNCQPALLRSQLELRHPGEWYPRQHSSADQRGQRWRQDTGEKSGSNGNSWACDFDVR
jgi:hypothetical protein